METIKEFFGALLCWSFMILITIGFLIQIYEIFKSDTPKTKKVDEVKEPTPENEYVNIQIIVRIHDDKEDTK